MIRQSSPLATAATFFLLLIVILGPLPFGGILMRERTFLGLCAVAALMAMLLVSPRLEGWQRWGLPAAALGAIGILGLLQSVAWPSGWVRSLAPELGADWDRAGQLLATSYDRMGLSVAPEVSRVVGDHWLAVAACFSAAALVGADRRRRRILAAGYLTIASFQVLYGAENWFGRDGRIWGIEVAGEADRLRGTYVNSDHLAMLLSIAVAGVAAWWWWGLRRSSRGVPLEQRLLLGMMPGLAFFLIFAGALFTGSRAGLLALLGALTTQALLLASMTRRWQIGAAVLGTMGAGLGFFAVVGWESSLSRFLSTSAYEIAWNTRFDTYRASWELFLRSPWTGTGLGTFRQAFPAVQPPELRGTWTHAHNDVLELLVTTGVIGASIALVGFIACIVQLWRVCHRGPRSEDRALGLAAAGALVAVLVHSLLDFGLTIPANAFAFVILVGMALGVQPVDAAEEIEP